MAYHTTYRLEISEPGPSLEDVAARMAELSDQTTSEHPQHALNVRFWTDVLRGHCDNGWYDHDDHMRIVSAQWPDVLFTLYGTGDEHDDEWLAYYQNGWGQRHTRPVWNPPPFDTEQLH